MVNENDKKVKSNSNLILYGIIAFLAVLVVLALVVLVGAGVFFLMNSNNGASTSHTQQNTLQPSVQQPSAQQSTNPSQPTGCQYNNPSCSQDYECLNNQCNLKRGCQYNNPTCQYNQDCVNNVCVMKQCPYECCDGTEYQRKDCQTDYTCLNHACKPTDSDGDGLYDYEEKRLGTNPNLADSDGDTLSDYQEVKLLKTNPLNSNTDGDRYLDANDIDPIKKNSALIKTKLINMKQDKNLVPFVAAAAACYFSACTLNIVLASVAPDIWIYRNTYVFNIENTGDDYTSYYNAEFSIYYSDKNYSTEQEALADLPRIRQNKMHGEEFSLGRIEAGAIKSITFIYEIKLVELPESLLKSILGETGTYVKVIESDNYEKFE